MRFSATAVPVVLLAVLGIAFIGPVSQANAATCQAPKTAFKTSDSSTTTTSQQFKVIPGSTVKFTSTAKSCVIIRVSIEIYTPFGDQADVQVLLDGNLVPPGTVIFRGNVAGTPEMRSAEFIVNKVPKGAHIVKVRWRGDGDNLEAYGRTTSVQFK